MMPDAAADRHPSFAGYRVETIVKEDGRRIRYYRWPEEPPSEVAEPAESPAPADVPAEERGV